MYRFIQNILYKNFHKLFSFNSVPRTETENIFSVSVFGTETEIWNLNNTT